MGNKNGDVSFCCLCLHKLKYSVEVCCKGIKLLPQPTCLESALFVKWWKLVYHEEKSCLLFTERKYCICCLSWSQGQLTFHSGFPYWVFYLWSWGFNTISVVTVLGFAFFWKDIQMFTTLHESFLCTVNSPIVIEPLWITVLYCSIDRSGSSQFSTLGKILVPLVPTYIHSHTNIVWFLILCFIHRNQM